VLARLRAGVGDALWLAETERGCRLTAQDPDVERQMGLLRRVMVERRSVLGRLVD